MTSYISYDQMKSAYQDFLKNPPKDNFSRYFEELGFMQSLIAFAKQQGLQEDVFEYEKIKQNAIDQMEKIRQESKE